MHSKPCFLFWAILAALFAITTTPMAAASSKFKVLYNFTGGADGGAPNGLVQDAAGNLYGTASSGGNLSCWGGCGTVFKLDKAGKLTVLYSFTGGADGAWPYSTLTISGNTLYGTASDGGERGCFYDYGCGTVFSVDIQTGALEVLHTFDWSDGMSPGGGLILRSGIFYGTTPGGGSGDCGNWGCGLVYELVLKTGAYTVLHLFHSSDGQSPGSTLTLDKAGKVLYGATPIGGAACHLYLNGCGVLFKLTLKTDTFKVLYNFTGSPDAAYPNVPLVIDSSGNLIGDTNLGGSSQCGSLGCGTVFMVDPNTGTDTVLFDFMGGADGNQPEAGVLRSSSGTLYGTTAYGGSTDNGTVFELTNGREIVLHSFRGSDGSRPAGNVIMDSKGNLYGTAFSGGSHGKSGCAGFGCGVAWKITR